jgi:hypothetical protein
VPWPEGPQGGRALPGLDKDLDWSWDIKYGKIMENHGKSFVIHEIFNTIIYYLIQQTR